MEYEIAGGGGTDFEVCWNYSKEEGIHQKVCYVHRWLPWDSWGDESTVILCLLYTVVVMVVKFEASFRITVPYERND